MICRLLPATCVEVCRNLPLTDTHFHWMHVYWGGFVDLKFKLISTTILWNPDYPRRAFEVHDDASKIVVGAWIEQRDQERTPHAIAYYTRKMKGPETRYSATDSKTLVVVEIVRAFAIFTDHSPLAFVFLSGTNNPHMSTWGLQLQTYDFKICYHRLKPDLPL